MTRLPFVAALVLSFGAAALRGAADGSSTPFRGGVDVVALDVCVKDRTGRPATGLGAGDFLVLEDHVPQRLAVFSDGDPLPLAVSLLVDTSLSMAGAPLEFARAAAGAFVAALAPGDLVEIIAFNDSATVLYPLGGDLPGAARALGPLPPSGLTALYRAILAGLNRLERNPAARRRDYRRVAVVLTDGENTDGMLPYDHMLDAARRSGVLVYTISLSTRAAADGPATPPWTMTRLANDTGGRAVAARAPAALAGVYQEIASELRQLYRIGYVPARTDRDGRWRTISVRVPGRPLVARTRAGYYAPRAPRSLD
jgi:VWFA-related protein